MNLLFPVVLTASIFLAGCATSQTNFASNSTKSSRSPASDAFQTATGANCGASMNAAILKKYGTALTPTHSSRLVVADDAQRLVQISHAFYSGSAGSADGNGAHSVLSI